MREYCFCDNQVELDVYSFGVIFTLDYNTASCPRVSPVRDDIIHYGTRTFEVDSADNFDDDNVLCLLCSEVK